MKYLRVVNHERHQHYKNRNPPWIKLHRSCLDSYRFTSLPDNARWHALGIALIASQTENHVPADPAWLKAALHSTTKVDVSALIAAGFVEPCTNGAGCKRCASGTLASSASNLSLPEEERREEAEERREEEIPEALDTPEFLSAWTDYKTHRTQIRKPMGDLAKSRALAKLERFGVSVAVTALGESIENGWQGVFPEKVNGGSDSSGRKSAGKRQSYGHIGVEA